MKRIIAPVVLGAALTLSACGGGSSSHASSGAKDAASKGKSAASSPSYSSAALIDDATLKSYAEKLGCSNPDVKTKASAKAKALGAASLIDCSAGSMEYVMVRTATTDAASKVVAAVMDDDDSSHGMPYVLGTNWVVLANKSSQDTPTKADAQSVQAKLGGEVKTLP